jgi:hypothetical protein
MRHVSGVCKTGYAKPMRRSSIEARGGQSSERFTPRRRIKDSTRLSPGLSGVFAVLRALRRGLKLSVIQGSSNAI